MLDKVYDIFISYRRKDAQGYSNVATARTFYLKFDSLHYDVFFDYSECTDNIFSDKILPAIRTCRYFLLILTKDTLDRCKNEGDWVRREIEEALKYGRKIVPVTPDDNEFEGWPAGLPESFTPLTANGGVQVTTIHMGRMFDKTIEVLIDDRMGSPSAMKNNTVTDSDAHCLKIRADIDCNVYIDDDPRGVAESGRVFKISLSEGQYLLRFENCANAADSIEETLDMPDKDILHPVALLSIQQERIKKEREARGEFTVGGVDFQMKYVEGGTFTMGATPEQGGEAESDEKPVHKVTVSDYCIGETVVTQALWKAVMGDNPSDFKGDDNCPVERVSWNDVTQRFIPELNRRTGRTFRLPTEAEWEFAARGGNKSKGYKYSGSDDINDVAWHEGNSHGKTHPVKSKKPNELGLYDMSGNVWEWCKDEYGNYSGAPQVNPGLESESQDSGQDRVCRGGGWFSNARYCRVACRSNYAPVNHYYLGFRLVFSPA